MWFLPDVCPLFWIDMVAYVALLSSEVYFKILSMTSVKSYSGGRRGFWTVLYGCT